MPDTDSTERFAMSAHPPVYQSETPAPSKLDTQIIQYLIYIKYKLKFLVG